MTLPPTNELEVSTEDEFQAPIVVSGGGWLRRVIGFDIPDIVWYNWRCDVIAGLCAGAYQGCIWTFALQLARGKLHATGFQIGLVTAAQAIGYIFALIWARQMEGRSKLPFVTITWTIARGSFLLTPLLVQGQMSRGMFVAILCSAPIIFSISTPAYTSIMKDIYPDHLRGRLMSYVRIGMYGTMLISARLMGILQEHYNLDFRVMCAIGGVFGVGTAAAFSRLKLPENHAEVIPPPIKQFMRETFLIVVHNPGYRWFTVSVFVSGFGNLVANTLYPIYQVDHFKITPTQMATMQNISGILAMISLFFWGHVLDRYGSLAAVFIAASALCLQPLCYAFGPSIGWLYVGAAVAGAVGTGIDLGYLNTTLMYAEPGRAAQYQALHSTFFGLRGTIAPLLAAPMLIALNHNFPVAFCLSMGIMVLGAVFQAMSFRYNYQRGIA